MNELHLFAGIGGGILGGILCGHTTVCAVEIEPYCRQVLLQRQRDGMLPRFPIWDDVCTFDGTPWQGRVDLISGGFPCQDISTAGTGDGLDGDRSGLWDQMRRIIHQVDPKYVYVENSPALTSRGLGTVLKDLAKMGYNARWGVLGACHVGADHKRARIWIMAHAASNRLQGHSPQQVQGQQTLPLIPYGGGVTQWEKRPDKSKYFYNGMGDGVPNYVERAKALGNGQVAAVAATAWAVLGSGGVL